MSAHAPEPWTVHESIVSLEVRSPVGVIADVFYGGGGEAFSPGMAEANARLIAAAPDLLALVQDQIEVNGEPCNYDHNGFCQEHYWDRPCWMERARAAVDKARNGGRA